MKRYHSLGRLSFRMTLIKRLHKIYVRQRPFDLGEQRLISIKNMRRVCGESCNGVKIKKINWNNYKAHFYKPEKLVDDEWTVLYLHGGGYIFNNVDLYDGFVARFSKELGLKCYSFDYPLAPEFPFPNALNATAGFYKYIVSNGCDPSKIILAGDSAGGGLCLAVAKQLQKEDFPLPALFALFSPWTDLTNSGVSIAVNAKKDLVLTVDLLENAAKLYCDDKNPELPAISPLYDDFTGFPPIYLLAGSQELLLSDSDRLCEALEKCGVDVYYTVWRKMPHAFVVGARLLPESRKALTNVKKFIHSRIGTNSEK